MNPGGNDPRDALSVFDSEGPDLATPPDANRDLLHGSEDPVREIRQRLLAVKPEGPSPLAIPGRPGAMKIRISETAADIQLRVMSRLRNYIVQHPKLLVPMASIACVLIIAIVVEFAVDEVQIV